MARGFIALLRNWLGDSDEVVSLDRALRDERNACRYAIRRLAAAERELSGVRDRLKACEAGSAVCLDLAESYAVENDDLKRRIDALRFHQGKRTNAHGD